MKTNTNDAAAIRIIGTFLSAQAARRLEQLEEGRRFRAATLLQNGRAATIDLELLKLPPEAIGEAWALEALQVRPWRPIVERWLQTIETLPGADVEKIKGLVFDPSCAPPRSSCLAGPASHGSRT